MSSLRVVDHNVKRGVQVDMGDGDEWPQLRERILAADILLLATPIWMGHPASVAQQVLERLDADLSETDDQGRPVMYGKVAAVADVGNEDEAHKSVADMMQGLNDVGFSIPAQGGTYWVGEAMQTVDFKDLDRAPSPPPTQPSPATPLTSPGCCGGRSIRLSRPPGRGHWCFLGKAAHVLCRFGPADSRGFGHLTCSSLDRFLTATSHPLEDDGPK